MITTFVALFAILGAWQAQAADKLPRIAQISGECSINDRDRVLLKALGDLGYIANRSANFERTCYRTESEMQTVLQRAVQQHPDVIIVGSPASAVAARMVTGQIPIVCASCGDPLQNGLVASLARPGGNITGLASLSAELVGKRLELIKELAPGISRVAALMNPDNPGTRPTQSALDEARRRLKLDIVRLEFRSVADLAEAFAAAAKARVGAVLIQDDPFAFSGRSQIAELGAKYRLPTIAGLPEVAEVGGLIAYGPDRLDLFRRAAGFVDKILKGANPAELPIEQPSKFNLIVNLKTARALQVDVPKSLLLRADKIIE
jgi:putative ABC transport system substrate-binding protein